MLASAHTAAGETVWSVDPLEKVPAFTSNSLTHCPLRVNVSQQVIQQLRAEVSVPATYEATGIYPRCAPMINFQLDVAVQQVDVEMAGLTTEEGMRFDPLLDYAWLLRSRYLLVTGDVAGAEAAADEAEKVQALYPESADTAALEALRAEIKSARG